MSTAAFTGLYAGTLHCLQIDDPKEKAAATTQLYQQHQQLADDSTQVAVSRLERPGMPVTPKLVEPRQMKRRSMGSEQGRIALLHALAHIEFNAINLALDAAYRFRDMPAAYYSDWLQVASDEARHFCLLADRLESLDSHYGALEAHAGLWQMALKTDHDVLVRMALVPRVLEARGLDVAPPMIERLNNAGDTISAGILQQIYQDEIEHVRIGNHWYNHVCTERGVSATEVFSSLLKQHSKGVLRGPYNAVARVQAGFTQDELDALAIIEKEFREN